MEHVHILLNNILMALLVAAAPFVLALMYRGVNAGLDYLKTRTRNTRLLEAIETIRAVVTEINEVEKVALAEKSKDGKLDKADGLYLRDLAVNKIKVQLGDKGMKFLNSIRGDGEAFIKTQIEAALVRFKARFF